MIPSRLIIVLILLTSLVSLSGQSGGCGGGEGPQSTSEDAQQSSDSTETGTDESFPTAELTLPNLENLAGQGTVIESQPYNHTSIATHMHKGIGKQLNSSIPSTELCIANAALLEDIPGPMSYKISAGDFSGNVIYVNADATTSGDGSKNAPYQTITEALTSLKSVGLPAAILVAGGNYTETLTLYGGVYLFGSFDQNWQQDLVNSPSRLFNKKGSLTIESTGTDKPTVINGFYLYGSLELNPQDVNWAEVNNPTILLKPEARLIAHHNLIHMGLSDVRWKTYGDTHYGQTLTGGPSRVLLYQNRFRPIDPAHVPYHKGLDLNHFISSAIVVNDSCIDLINNHFQDFRWSLKTRGTSGITVQNVFETGYGFIDTFNEHRLIEGNTFGSRTEGGTFNIYLGGTNNQDATKITQPKIKNNVFMIFGSHAGLVNEVDEWGDPQALTNNKIVRMNNFKYDFPLYGDFDTKDPADNFVNRRITSIDEVNALKDIPENGNNTLQ